MFDSVFDSDPAKMIKNVHELLDEADVVCHYNGKKFDIPTLNQEFLLQDLSPPSQFKQLDLLTTTRQQFRFPSNKLDYVVQQLGLGQKTSHKGMELWHDCMKGCPKAWATMKRYNMQDVRLTERWYLKLLPWIKSHPNWGVYLDSSRPTCRNCGSAKVKRNGKEYTNTYTYQRYRCTDCGTPLRGRKSLHPAPDGLTV